MLVVVVLWCNCKVQESRMIYPFVATLMNPFQRQFKTGHARVPEGNAGPSKSGFSGGGDASASGAIPD